MPFLRVLILAFALVHATGLSDALDVACAGECAEDDCDDGGCPPLCATCQCARCPAGVPIGIGGVDAPKPELVLAIFPDTERAPSSPDPGEILRVPILLLV